MRYVVVFAFAIAACETRVVDLGIDAPIDTPPSTIDAATCRCRINRCRTADDCVLIGGACGPDFYCVGDFGACTTDAECQMRAIDSVCVTAADSTTACR